MGEMRDLANKIQDALRLRTFPLGVKFLEKAEDLDKIEKVRRPEEPLTFCQIIGMARHMGWTIGATIDDISMPGCIHKLGFIEVEIYTDGTGYIPWTRTKEDAARCGASVPHLPFGKFQAVVVSPLASERFVPDIAWLFSNTAQMNFILNALQWQDYERLTFYFSGEGSCADAFVEAYLRGKPQMTVPCEGERIQGLVQEDELEIAMPAKMVKKLAEGIDGLRASRIISYPLPYYGFQMNTGKLMAKAYPGYEQYLSELRERAKKRAGK